MEPKNKLPTDEDHCADGPHGHEGCEGRHVGRGQADQAHGHQQRRRHRFPTKHVAGKILKFKQACFKFIDGVQGIQKNPPFGPHPFMFIWPVKIRAISRRSGGCVAQWKLSRFPTCSPKFESQHSRLSDLHFRS